jgi:broad specificity phosphatase PhoE
MNQIFSHTVPHHPFYFVRHGETDWNLEGRIMGHKDIPLNSRGIEQAHSAVPRLQDLGIKRIISSSLLRAKETAIILGSYLGIPIETTDALKEACWGEMEGELKSNYNGSFERWVKGETSLGGESCDAFQQRVVSALATILDTKEMPLIVAHSGVHWALARAFGQEDVHPDNGTPFLFQPPCHQSHPWSMCAVGEGK